MFKLELLISSLPNVDIKDLKANTDNEYHINILLCLYFWRALRGFDQANRAKFLQFVIIYISKVPLQGFATLEGLNSVQKFKIHREDRSTDNYGLPSAHTCFNQLDLPVYETLFF
ncbi:E3 ubiquitin-protein ligase HUWE1 [Ooceraea biroi]|uniref:HECT-type E3 ubiquitin transferase n=1 Tax=Ooceraea biroi TaxID=2015173 RepID=A0A026WVE2_OOCBI|nr:E3 ubiquitin-protein ligase HUWE1 [Ooceraea biroi]